MELWGGKVVGGRGRAGEVAGRAVLFVPLEGIWELHDLSWDRPDGECEDSHWDDKQKTLDVTEDWEIDWVEPSQLRTFISEHFGDLNADDVAGRSA
jgi:hypothetical protein